MLKIVKNFFIFHRAKASKMEILDIPSMLGARSVNLMALWSEKVPWIQIPTSKLVQWAHFLSNRTIIIVWFLNKAKHYEHKGDHGVTPTTCGAIGERAQVILI
jgi:hypothetical protein